MLSDEQEEENFIPGDIIKNAALDGSWPAFIFRSFQLTPCSNDVANLPCYHAIMQEETRPTTANLIEDEQRIDSALL